MPSDFCQVPLTDTSYFTGPDWILGLYQSASGRTVEADPVKRNQLLAEAIPALSKPVGANLCQNILSGNQFDMAVQFADSADWPRPKNDDNIPLWRHSDMDQLAYAFIYGLYNQLVSISNQ